MATLGPSGLMTGNPERVCSLAKPLRGLMGHGNFFVPGLPKLNPGLEFVNTFGVGYFTVVRILVAVKLRCVIGVIGGLYSYQVPLASRTISTYCLARSVITEA